MSADGYEDIGREAALSAMRIIEALEVAEVQEALAGWSHAAFQLIRAFERADLTRAQLAGIMGGSVVDTLAQMQAEDEE